MKILITGGCGFVGSHLTDRCVSEGHSVRVYDLLEPQVHRGKKPSFLNKGAEYVFKDVRDKESLRKALKGIDVVFHQAAQVGVGQSMYEIERYVSHNALGTAVLLELLVNGKNSVRKLVVASSMSIYGEGAYGCRRCGPVSPRLREARQLKARRWEPACPSCGRTTESAATPESKPLFPTSVYATTKRDQEEMCLAIGAAYKIPTVALRYFNIYGPRQSLNNPYTGVAAIFLSQVKNGNAPLIFEDGNQSRDFIYVSDIVEANMLAMKKSSGDYRAFNVGTGSRTTINDVAGTIIALYDKRLRPRVLSKFRAGDIRHCFADISAIRSALGFTPAVGFKEGMKALVAWSETQDSKDSTAHAQAELRKRGLAS